MTKSFDDLMNMTDDELMSQNTINYGEDKESETTAEASAETAEDKEDTTEAEDDKDTEDTDASGSTEGSDTDTKEGADAADPAKKANSTEEDKTKSADKSAKSPNGEADKAKETETKAENNQVIDYEKAYKEIMKPFKANGREVTLNNPEEAVKLMQMGANYVKKMQAIQPNLKVLRMLEKNELLDESKLGELIDVAKGDKAALAKFVKDRNIDPMDIDPETAVDYKPGNHKIADAEINFQSTLEELNSSDAGQNLIIQMQHSWDTASRQEVFKEPAHLKTLEQHMQIGIYDQIAAEVEKQKALGHPQIASMPFLKAYEVIGRAMADNKLLKPIGPAQAAPSVQERAVQELGRGPAPAKKQATNGAQAKAASPSAKSTKKAAPSFNPLAVSDEEFLKQWENRV